MRAYIEGINHRGEGVARIDGKVVFIPFAIPGELLEVEITEKKKTFSRGKIVRIIEPSIDRVQAPCPYYYDCGGCSYQHLNYARELELKQQIVKDCVERIGKLQVPVLPVIGMGNPWRYRNKVEWHLAVNKDKPVMGYYCREEREILEIDSCLLISEEMERLSNELQGKISQYIKAGVHRITVRQSSIDNTMGLIFHGSSPQGIKLDKLLKDNPLISSAFFAGRNKMQHLFGEPYIKEKIGNITYQLSPLAFFQINHLQSEKLFGLVKDYANHLQGGEKILDAYCGTGSIALFMAENAGKVLGVESFAFAVDDARINARINGIENCEFKTGKCEEITPRLDENFNLVILDPPRAGCKKELINALIAMSPEKIIYVSCNPATMARDLALLKEGNYNIEKIQPVDMFPRTGHVETVVLITRVKE